MAIPFVWNVSVLEQGQLNYIVAILMVAIGLNLVLGYAGQLFLGPGAMFAAGAYAAAYMAVNHPQFQSLGMMSLVAVIASVALAAIVALPALRVSGFYLGLLTLFIAQSIPLVASHVVHILGGVTGLSLFTDPTFVQHPEGRALYELGV